MTAINIFITPTQEESGLTTISLGLYQALDSRGLRVGFLKPIAPRYDKVERSSYLARQVLHLTTPNPIPLNQVQQTISQGKLDQVLEDCVAMHADVAEGCDVVLIEGLIADNNEPYTSRLNIEIAKTLDASILLVVNGLQNDVENIIADIKLQMSLFGPKANFIGCVLNKVLPPGLSASLVVTDDDTDSDDSFPAHLEACQNINIDSCPVLGVIPWQPELISPRTLDIARALNVKIINQGELETRRVSRVSLCARTVPNMIDELRPGTLIVTPGDRDDIIIAVAMAANNGTPLAGLLLTSGYSPNKSTDNLCQQAWDTGLPILSVESNSYATATQLSNISTHVPMDDVDRVKRIMTTISDHINAQKLLTYIGEPQQPRLSPAAFRHQLSSMAKADMRRIVLPEGDEPRTIQAAVICQNKGIADCVLIGSTERIHHLAQSLEIQLPENLTIIQPEQVREHYVAKMVELRKHKNLSEPMAMAQLEDNVVLGTMMLVLDEVDGLVSGATHTTANTIRPALQLIKTATNAKLVSSIFFMGLPDQVLVYGDCAVNPDPNAEELADIAIQSADSATAMGIEARVAMISYSTGQSGQGTDVEKVREATALVKQLRPDIIVDGPLQYDAATTPSVARSKAPDSLVAGKATVLVFPDLNTGNTTYKAVQRSANVISIGPMLQGLAKPVNDLSRGALVDDIVYTIALTAIQAQHQQARC